MLALAAACSRAASLPVGIDQTKLQAVQAQVDFPVAVPRYLPLGLRMVGAEALPPARPDAPKEVHMSFFAYPDGPGLQFTQGSCPCQADETIGEPGVTFVTVQGDTMARLYQDPYRQGRTYLSLSWQRQDMQFGLWGFLERGLTREQLLKIAESVQ